MPPAEPIRVLLPGYLHQRLEAIAQDGENRELDVSDLIELCLTALLPPDATPGVTTHEAADERERAVEVLEAMQQRRYITREQLAQLPVRTTVMAFRMGPVIDLSDADGPEVAPDGYVRNRMGMSLGGTPALVWEAARGYWRAVDDADYIVPTRFGYAPYVFRVADWENLVGGRIWARRGWLVDLSSPEPRLLRLREARPDEVTSDGSLFVAEPEPDEPLRNEDVEIARAISGRVLALGKRGANPVIRVKQRTRSARPR